MKLAWVTGKMIHMLNAAADRVKWTRSRAAKRAACVVAAAYALKTLYPIIGKHLKQSGHRKKKGAYPAAENREILHCTEATCKKPSPGVNADFFQTATRTSENSLSKTCDH